MEFPKKQWTVLVIVVRPSGSHCRDLVSRCIKGRLKMFSACFNKYSKTLLMAFQDAYVSEFQDRREAKVMIYRIDMNDA